MRAGGEGGEDEECSEEINGAAFHASFVWQVSSFLLPWGVFGGNVSERVATSYL